MPKTFKYEVLAGDNPARLAKRLYGDERLYTEIVKAAGGGLTPGMTLKLPDLRKYQEDLRRRGEKHFVSQAEFEYGQSLGGRNVQPKTTTPQTQVNLQNPPGFNSQYGGYTPTGSTTTPSVPGSVSQNQYVGYIPPGQGGGFTPIAPPAPTSPKPLPPPKTGGRTNTQAAIYFPKSQGARASVQPPLQGNNPLKPGAATGFYTGVGNQPYSQSTYTPEGPVDYANPAYLRPQHPTAGGNFGSNVPTNQQQNVTAGMTGQQQALALESAILNKVPGTYQVRRGEMAPVLDANGNIVGWNIAQTGATINVSATGTKPAAYVGWTDPMGKPGGPKVIGGGEGYNDYIAGQPPRVTLPTAPATGGPGGYGPGGYGGGGGGGRPGRGGGRGAVGNRYTPPVYAQSSSLPGGARNPAREAFGLSRTGLVTWRL